MDRGQHSGLPLAGQRGEVRHPSIPHVRVKELPVGAVESHEEHGAAFGRGAGDLSHDRRISGSGGGEGRLAAGGQRDSECQKDRETGAAAHSVIAAPGSGKVPSSNEVPNAATKPDGSLATVPARTNESSSEQRSKAVDMPAGSGRS